LAPGIFDVLAYTDAETAVPFTWVESDAKLIDNPQMVKLHSFDTKVNSSFLLGMQWSVGA
jgi:mitotic spindle assembly checkpoint protein MAD2